MEGDQFFQWFRLKQKLNHDKIQHFCHERDIWVCSIGKNIGSEQNGKRELFQRPVLVIKKFGNGTFFGIPLTSTVSYSDFTLQISGGSFLVLSQVRLFDMRRRLVRKMRRIDEKELAYILAAFMKMFNKK